MYIVLTFNLFKYFTTPAPGEGYMQEKGTPSDSSFRRMLFETETGGEVCELRELSEPDYIDE